MTEKVQQWVEQAQYDLDTAQAMQDAGRYLYVLFCCQQAIEKLLKAMIMRRTGGFPPRIHNLVDLTQRVGLTVTETQRTLLRRLTEYYTGSRYSEDMRQLEKDINSGVAAEFLANTKEFCEWLLSTLQ